MTELLRMGFVVVLSANLLTFAEIIVLAQTNKSLKKYIFEDAPKNHVFMDLFTENMQQHLAKNYVLTIKELNAVLLGNDAFISGGFIPATVHWDSSKSDVVVEYNKYKKQPDLDIFVLGQTAYVNVRKWFFENGFYESSLEYAKDDTYEHVGSKGDFIKYSNMVINCSYFEKKTSDADGNVVVESGLINIIHVTNRDQKKITPQSVVLKFDLNIVCNFYTGSELYIAFPHSLAAKKFARNANTMYDPWNRDARRNRIAKYNSISQSSRCISF